MQLKGWELNGSVFTWPLQQITISPQTDYWLVHHPYEGSPQLVDSLPTGFYYAEALVKEMGEAAVEEEKRKLSTELQYKPTIPETLSQFQRLHLQYKHVEDTRSVVYMPDDQGILQLYDLETLEKVVIQDGAPVRIFYDIEKPPEWKLFKHLAQVVKDRVEPFPILLKDANGVVTLAMKDPKYHAFKVLHPVRKKIKFRHYVEFALI